MSFRRVRTLSFVIPGLLVTSLFILYSSYMKKLIYLGIAIGGTLGGWLGSLLDHGNALGGWAILGGAIGSCIGIWAGYKLGTNS